MRGALMYTPGLAGVGCVEWSPTPAAFDEQKVSRLV